MELQFSSQSPCLYHSKYLLTLILVLNYIKNLKRKKNYNINLLFWQILGLNFIAVDNTLDVGKLPNINKRPKKTQFFS